MYINNLFTTPLQMNKTEKGRKQVIDEQVKKIIGETNFETVSGMAKGARVLFEFAAHCAEAIPAKTVVPMIMDSVQEISGEEWALFKIHFQWKIIGGRVIS